MEGTLHVEKVSTEEGGHTKAARSITMRFEKHHFFLFDDLLLETSLGKDKNYKFKAVYNLSDIVFQRNRMFSSL